MVARSGQRTESKRSVEKHRRTAIRNSPTPADSTTGRLQDGDFANGWDDYESRWTTQRRRIDLTLPEWDGSPLHDKRLFVYAEQDLGEQILFASCLNELLPATRSCRVECDPRLVPLFQRSFPLADVVATPGRFEERSCDLSVFDSQLPIGGLPRYFRRSESDFARGGRYLVADLTARHRWTRRLAALGDRPKVGISWRGGKERDARLRRSTTLEQWRPLFEVESITCINLQYDGDRAELNAVRDVLGTTIHKWDDVNPRQHLDDFAAQIASLDLVITVDNSTAHLAGALGVPTWTLLPDNANWRWMRDRTDSPWFPSMRLFRQPEPEAWEPVFAEVAMELSKVK